MGKFMIPAAGAAVLAGVAAAMIVYFRKGQKEKKERGQLQCQNQN